MDFLTYLRRKAGYLALAISAAAVGQLDAALPDALSDAECAAKRGQPIDDSYISVVQSLIDDAMEDGSISPDERQLILRQARRYLSEARTVELEAQLASVSATNIIPVSTSSLEESESEAAAAERCTSCCDEAGCGGLFDNMVYFANVEGWQSPVDLGLGPSNFGGRVGLNMGAPLVEFMGIGAQFGVSYGFYDFHGRGDLVGVGHTENSSVEDHLTGTFGVFRRANLCDPCGQRWSAGVAYDLLYADNIGPFASEIFLGQWRLQLGYALGWNDEVGFWTTQGDQEDRLKPLKFDVQPMHQYNIYWHHKWYCGADSRGWFGLAEQPGSLVFGADLHYPLNDCLAFVGTAQYIHPSSSPGESTPFVTSGFAQESWNIVVGLAYYPGGNSHSKTVAGQRWMPYFSVADNGSFALATP